MLVRIWRMNCSEKSRRKGPVARHLRQSRRKPKENFFPFIPLLLTHAYNFLVPHRIHQEASWRGGAGAGDGGKTQNLILRVRGKWSPSGDTGEAGWFRTGQPASDARKSAPGVPVRHTWWPKGWFRRTCFEVRPLTAESPAAVPVHPCRLVLGLNPRIRTGIRDHPRV